MLERFFKSQVATVSDSTYCHRITDALTAAGIKCYCKTKDVNQRSVFDATRMRAQIRQLAYSSIEVEIGRAHV